MTEPFFISAILAILLLGLRLSGKAKDDPGPKENGWSGSLLGAVIGAAALLRQTVLFWIPFQLIWMFWASSSTGQELATCYSGVDDHRCQSTAACIRPALDNEEFCSLWRFPALEFKCRLCFIFRQPSRPRHTLQPRLRRPAAEGFTASRFE